MSHSTENAYVHSVEFSTKSITRSGETNEVDLANLRVNVDRSRRNGEDEQGNPIYDDSKSFWVDVELWGPRVKHLKGVVSKGATIMMTGRYDNNTWKDKETEEEKSRQIFVADEIAVLPRCIASITLKANGESAST